MDYGQPVKTGNDPEFFTSGAGTNAEKDNLDPTNNQADWVPSVERDKREIGNTAVQGLAEAPGDGQSLDQPPEIPQNPLEKETTLGEVEVVDMELPPEAEQNRDSIGENKIKADDNEQKIDDLEVKLDQDGDADSFYEARQKLIEEEKEKK